MLRKEPRPPRLGRTVYGSATRWRIATRSLEKAEPVAPGQFEESLVAITFAAFAFEALSNDACELKFTSWREHSAWHKKLQHLCGVAIGGPVDLDGEPWSIVRDAFWFRD